MFVNEGALSSVNENNLVVVDWDNVIQEICGTWILNLKENEEYFSKYFDFSKIDTNEKINNVIFNREEYWLDKELAGSPEKGFLPLTEEIKKDFMALYVTDPNFYSKCLFLNSIQIIYTLLDTDKTQRVAFLSHCSFKHTRNQKKEIFEEVFGDDKRCSFSGIHPDKQMKSTWMNTYLKDWSIFIDDYSENVKDVLTNCDCRNKKILMPLYGYNQTPEILKELNDLSIRKECQLAFYKPQYN